MNWRRNLTSNQAATDAASSDLRLRPLQSPHAPAATAELVQRAAATLRGWEFAGKQSEGGGWVLRFVRSTRWLKFKDDVTVRILAAGGGSRVEAESRSRVGKADFGQNPRNLRELLHAVRLALKTSHASGEQAGDSES